MNSFGPQTLPIREGLVAETPHEFRPQAPWQMVFESNNDDNGYVGLVPIWPPHYKLGEQVPASLFGVGRSFSWGIADMGDEKDIPMEWTNFAVVDITDTTMSIVTFQYDRQAAQFAEQFTDDNVVWEPTENDKPLIASAKGT
jgi:hypothetical protein